jgi:hypothetical protein
MRRKSCLGAWLSSLGDPRPDNKESATQSEDGEATAVRHCNVLTCCTWLARCASTASLRLNTPDVCASASDWTAKVRVPQRLHSTRRATGDASGSAALDEPPLRPATATTTARRAVQACIMLQSRHNIQLGCPRQSTPTPSSNLRSWTIERLMATWRSSKRWLISPPHEPSGPNSIRLSLARTAHRRAVMRLERRVFTQHAAVAAQETLGSRTTDAQLHCRSLCAS